MFLCNDNHEDIVYNSLICPVCSLLVDKDELQYKFQDAKDYVKKLQDKLDNANIDY